MDVSCTVDRSEACLCSSLDPPAPFSYTFYALRICLSLLGLVLFEPFACFQLDGSEKGFFVASILLKLYWADSCLCDTRASVLCQPAAL